MFPVVFKSIKYCDSCIKLTRAVEFITNRWIVQISKRILTCLKCIRHDIIPVIHFQWRFCHKRPPFHATIISSNRICISPVHVHIIVFHFNRFIFKNLRDLFQCYLDVKQKDFIQSVKWLLHFKTHHPTTYFNETNIKCTMGLKTKMFKRIYWNVEE